MMGVFRGRCRVRDERGSFTISLAILAVPFFLLVLLIVQAGVYTHARQVATAAAQEGLRAARNLDGSGGAGQAQAGQLLAQTAGTTLRNTSVSARRHADWASVDVHGQVVSLVPGLTLTVDAHAEGPVERYTVEGAR